MSLKRHIRTLLSKTFIRYMIIGGTAFSVEYLSFLFLFVVCGVPLTAANALSFCLGLSVSFSLNRLWTFGGKEFHKKVSHQFGFYAALALINLLLTLILVAVMRSHGLDPKIAKLIAMILTSTWNFLFFKLIIFKHKP